MAEHVIRLPDVGEGIAEAELVEWHVKIGDLVRADDTLAAVMTDKATVEIPSPVDGEVLWLGAEIGDAVPVGSDLVRLKVGGVEHVGIEQPARVTAPAAARPARLADSHTADVRPTPAKRPAPAFANHTLRPGGEKPVASPAVRQRARDNGVDLRQVPGTGPAGRITHEDLEAWFARDSGAVQAPGRRPLTGVEDVRIVGLRRRIAEKMSVAHTRIPHITYVEEVDVTALEELRGSLNTAKRDNQPRLTLLPFLMLAMVRTVAEQPNLNALFDDEAGIVHQHAGVHVGIAVQTDAGLMVPVVRHAEALDLWSGAAEINQLAEATKTGGINRDELTGSTITITSLGALGGVMSTPIINHPEVAIVGVNKIMVQPVWDGSTFIPRKMMNLSSSFDHRVIDGFDAARFVQRIKVLLETPALIFMAG